MRGVFPRQAWGRVAVLLAACVLMLGAWAEPIIPGLATGTLDPELRGQVLIEELNCVACHAGVGSLKARSKQAPRLSEVGSRVNPAYLERYIAAPHETLPGTSMPDVLAAIDPEERRQTARARPSLM
jgi:cytochrome c2